MESLLIDSQIVADVINIKQNDYTAKFDDMHVQSSLDLISLTITILIILCDAYIQLTHENLVVIRLEKTKLYGHYTLNSPITKLKIILKTAKKEHPFH